jgi:hypothetical protein
MPATIRSMTPGSCLFHSSTIPVTTNPGAIALTRIPAEAYVMAADAVRLLTPRFAAP